MCATSMTEIEPISQVLDSRAFIVRIWRSGSDGRWRFSVQDVESGVRDGFADVESFLAHFDLMVRNPREVDDEGDGRADL